MTYYKVLAENGEPFHGGRGQWPLPRGKRPGKWLEIEGSLQPCARGLHLCRKKDLIAWIGPTIYVVEADTSELIDHGNKVVVRRARLLHQLETWNETTARIFAADCAKDAVRRCRKAGIEIDPRVDECIRVVYRFARGEASAGERSAAWSTAESASRLAARSAAWSASRLASWSASRSAAGSAARLAARSAAGSAARLAARSAAWSWQTKRLFEYLEGKRHV